MKCGLYMLPSFKYQDYRKRSFKYRLVRGTQSIWVLVEHSTSKWVSPNLCSGGTSVLDRREKNTDENKDIKEVCSKKV